MRRRDAEAVRLRYGSLKTRMGWSAAIFTICCERGIHQWDVYEALGWKTRAQIKRWERRRSGK